ncbi:MAG: carboxylating nicotinate-nucleotide diphosphorylase [Thermoguttaceae bacterium]
MNKEFQQSTWDGSLEEDLRAIVRLAVREDLGDLGDCTTAALVAPAAVGRAVALARQAGVIAGLPAAQFALRQFDPRIEWTPQVAEGAAVCPGQQVARLAGPARSLLTAERLVLNLLGRLSGIATLTRKYVEAVAGTKARIFDTRKTTPGWRRLEKYAVRAGGGWNHRTGLFDAVLIKDNHLAVGREAVPSGWAPDPGQAVRQVRQWLGQHVPETLWQHMIVEVEVDSLQQLEAVLQAGPDLVLLDNMSLEELRAAAARREAINPHVQLEASGGVNLENVRAIAQTGVDRISVGALTHSAASLDIAIEWVSARAS